MFYLDAHYIFLLTDKYVNTFKKENKEQDQRFLLFKKKSVPKLFDRTTFNFYLTLSFYYSLLLLYISTYLMFPLFVLGQIIDFT
jgi:hypothetical protein